MDDTLRFRSEFDNTQVNRAFEQLMARVRQTSRLSDRESTAIRNSLNRINNVQLRSSLLDGFNRQLAQSRQNAQGASSGIGGAISRVMDDVRSRAGAATPAVGGLVQSLMGLGPVAAIAGGVALAIGAIGSQAIQAASKQQQWLAQLETMTGSSQKAQESYAALVNFANKTPFDLGQSVEGFTKLRSLGIAATESRMTSFGNTAAAMGKSLNQLIEAVADASTNEFERLKEFGIKSKQEGDKVKFTFQGVTTTVGKNSKEITSYLESIGNTKFAGAMAKQMDTLKGAFSNVEDNLFQMMAAIGGGQLGEAVKQIAKGIASGISLITPLMASIGNAIGGIVNGVGAIINGVGAMFAGFGQGQAALNLMDGLTIAFNLVGEGAQVFGNIVGAVFGALGTLASSIGEMWRSSFGALFGDLTSAFESSGRSWSNSIVGILRAVKTVAGLMPQLFAVAINDVMRMFRNLGSIVGRLLSGDFSALKEVGGVLSNSFNNTARAVGAVGRIAAATYRDVKGADAAMGRLLGRTGTKPKLDTGVDATPDKSGDKKDKKKGKSDEEKEAERAAKKYADAIQNLKDRIADLALTQEQKALADELERAGLSRDTKQVNEKANAIRKLFAELKEGEKQKKVKEVLDDFNKSVRELGYNEMQLAQVEARRRAGLPEDLAITTYLTRKVDAQAAAYYRLQKAKADAQAIKDIERDQQTRKDEQGFDQQARTNPDAAEDARRVAQIERDRVANREKINAIQGITEAKRAELLATEDTLAAQDKQAVLLDRQQQKVQALSGFLENLWESPKEAMRQFFKDLMKKLFEAILRAIILKEKLGGTGGIGGLIGGAITSALGIGGGRATGGSVGRGDIRMVGENGPELVSFGAAGQVFNANATRQAMGSSGMHVSFGETTMQFSGNVNNETMAQLKAMQAQQQRENMNQMDAWARKRGLI